MPINSDGKVAYIYKDGTWYAISGAINTNASYTWTASQTFASPVTFEEVLISRAGINNFQSPETRDIAIPNPVDGAVCFVRQSTTGGTVINQLQYYHNGWKNVSGYSNVVSKLGSYSIDLNDAGKVITVDSSSASTIALPTNAELPIANGFKFDVVRLGTGTVLISSSATVLSKNPSAAYIDSQYGRVTVIKLDTNTWLVTGDVYEGSTLAPAPVAPAPVAPAPAPAPVSTPVAPSPVAPSPVAPVAPSPVAPSPVAPSPAAPVAPSPAPAPAPAPAPVGVTNYFGYCDLTNSPNGPFATSSSCIDAYNAQENANGYPPIGWVCGSTPQSGTPNCGSSPAPAPAPAAPAPAPAPAPSPAPVAPVSTSCVPADAWSYTKSMCQACGYYYSDTFGECSTTPWTSPAPIAPAPAAPAPAAPAPAPAPVAPSCVPADAWSYNKSKCQSCGYYYSDTFGECSTTPWTSPAPVAPSPVAPSPVAPSPVAPSPVAPSPVAPVAPSPAAPVAAPTGGGGQCTCGYCWRCSICCPGQSCAC